MLTKRARKISSAASEVSSNVILPGQFLVIPGMNFSCTGTISGFFLGVDVRNYQNKLNGVKIEQWRPCIENGMLTGYTYVSDGGVFTNIQPGEYTPNGVFKINASFQFQQGDVLGVYQNPRYQNIPVHLFYTTQLTPPRTFIITTPYESTYTINPSGHDLFNGTILMRPISGIMLIL